MAEQIALSVLAERIGARLRGGDPPFSGVSTDSRTLRPGDLFVALRGPNFDGHAFAAQAQARGAVALMVDRPLESALPTMEVEDTRIGLGRLAAG